MQLTALSLGLNQINPRDAFYNAALDLDFTTGTLDSRITFTRSTTGSYYNSAGVLSTAAINAPRFDYNPSTLQANGLLIEESRTNLLLYSEQFDNAAWVKGVNSFITPNVITAPDGTTTADKFVEAATTAQHLMYQSYATTSGTVYTYSVYAKAAEWTFFRMQLGGAGGVGLFDLSAITATTASGALSASIQPVGNGWFRCSLTATSNGDSKNFIYKQQATYTGDGTSGIYLWGAQLEAGSFATSYIPTVASQVTRAADVAVMTGTNFSSWYNQTEGTVYAEGDYGRNGVTAYISSIPDSDLLNAVNRYQIAFNAANNLSCAVVASGVTIVAALNSNISSTTFKSVLAIKSGDYAATINANAPNNSTAVGIPTVDRLKIGVASNGTSSFLNGHIKRLTYFNKRLSNGELVNLTL